MTNSQSKRNVLITGGTGSVGRALVKVFAAHDDRVTFQYHRDATAARRLMDECGARAIQLDFLSTMELPAVDFDVVINNAGVNVSDTKTHEVRHDAWDLTIKINLTVPFSVIRQCLPGMIARGTGRIINISSIYGLRAVEGNLPYTVSKHGLSGLTKTVAKEYASYGLTCNEICPGPIESDMMHEIAARASQASGISAESYLAEVNEEIPAKRMATPEEIASVAFFLASPEASYINGASLTVDGGLIA